MARSRIISILIMKTSLCLFSSGGVLAVNSVSDLQLFLEANKAALAGDMSEALANYQSLLNKGVHDPKVHYNLGITYFRSDKLGESIFHFRKARLLAPRDADIRFNLDYSRKAAIDKIEESTGLFSTRNLERFPFNEREGYYLLMIIIPLFALISIAYIFSRNDWLLWSQRLFALLTLFCILTVGFRLYLDQPFGVIITPEANVYSGTSKQSVLLFTLHEGTEFELTESKTDWVQIGLADAKRGWVQRSQIIY